jgi:hypothetical protein
VGKAVVVLVAAAAVAAAAAAMARMLVGALVAVAPAVKGRRSTVAVPAAMAHVSVALPSRFVVLNSYRPYCSFIFYLPNHIRLCFISVR